MFNFYVDFFLLFVTTFLFCVNSCAVAVAAGITREKWVSTPPKEGEWVFTRALHNLCFITGWSSEDIKTRWVLLEGGDLDVEYMFDRLGLWWQCPLNPLDVRMFSVQYSIRHRGKEYIDLVGFAEGIDKILKKAEEPENWF